MADVRRSSTTDILAAIERAHRLYFRDADRPQLFERMLDDVLALTDCEYGFIGEVLHHADGSRYLKSWALTNIAWDDATEALYAQSLDNDGGLVFDNLNTLFGRVLTSGETLISNDPAHDPRRGGLPPGHPPLDSFLGIPLYRNDDMIGMVGVANRADGFDESDVRELEPYLAVCAHMIDVIRTDRERSAALAVERVALATAARQERLIHLGRLASAVAHDVNGLINVISLQCELLEADPDLPDAAVAGIARIQEMCDRAIQMTNRLQRLRAAARRPDDSCVVVPAVTAALGFLRSVAGDDIQISMTADVEADVVVTISEGELVQVLFNLVSNSAEAMAGRGRIDIRILADPHLGGAGAVCIDVIDDGPGLPDEIRDDLFSPFVSTKGEGRGLGLAIVHLVLESNGGRIDALSVEHGAHFRVWLQKVQVAAAGNLDGSPVALVRSATARVHSTP